MFHPPEMSRKTLNKIRSYNVVEKNEHEDDGHYDSITGADGRDAYQRLCFNVNDFQILAKKTLRKDLYEYLASGSDDEQTLSENILGFRRWFLRPRVLRPVGRISTRTVLRFGQRDRGISSGNGGSRYFEFPVAMPVFVSPAGVHALCDEQHGECATARACAKASILFGLSQHSTRSIEDVAAATQPSGRSPASLKFYQAYILKDRWRTLSLIRRAIRAGYQGILLTVDSVRFGYREADARNGFNALPPPHRLVNYDDFASPSSDISSSSPASTAAGLDQTYNSKEKMAWDQNSEQMFEQNISWDHVRWIKQELTNEEQAEQGGCFVPLVIKGIMTAEDAILAVKAGADGIMVSNHGGRQLDGCLSAIDVLPEVSKAINGSVPIWIDGGIRRGTDVLKALALGASAVGIGKPVFFALGVGGEGAVSYLLNLLQTELEVAMAICGIERIEDISPSYVTRHPSSSSHHPEAQFVEGTKIERSLLSSL